MSRYTVTECDICGATNTLLNYHSIDLKQGGWWSRSFHVCHRCWCKENNWFFKRVWAKFRGEIVAAAPNDKSVNGGEG